MFYLDLNKNQIDQINHFVVILPIGAIEQHAGHLPLGTDTFIVECALLEVNKKIGDKVIILPPQWVGFSEEHKGFPGTLSLRVQTLKNIVLDLSEWLQTAGFKQLLLINSHGGNDLALKEVVVAWNKLNSFKLVYYDIWSKASDRLTEELFGGIDEHAGDSESSVMSAIRPDLVKDEIIPHGYVPRQDLESNDGFYAKTKTGAVNFKEEIVVDSKKGELLFNKMVLDLLSFIQTF